MISKRALLLATLFCVFGAFGLAQAGEAAYNAGAYPESPSFSQGYFPSAEAVYFGSAEGALYFEAFPAALLSPARFPTFPEAEVFRTNLFGAEPVNGFGAVNLAWSGAFGKTF